MTDQASEATKAIVQRFIDEVFVAGRAASVDELVAEDFRPHTWASTGEGVGDLKAAIDRVSAGLSDVSMVVEDMVAEGDRVAVRLTARATQTGDFMGLPPSGKSYEIAEIHWFRIGDGRIVEHWHQADLLGMLRQLGALPGG
jgi:steroid delta-isomerase-like uncharacterized protein